MKTKALVFVSVLGAVLALIPLLRSLAVADLEEDFERRKSALSVAVITLKQVDQYQIQQKYSGRVVARRESDHGFDRGGLLKAVLVEEGMRVEKGHLLARLDQSRLDARLAERTAELARAEANATQARARVEMARLSHDRYQNLLASKHISQARFDQVRTDLDVLRASKEAAEAAIAKARAGVENAKNDINHTHLRAQFSGMVLRRYVDEGTSVAAASPILRLIEDQVLEIHLGLPLTASRILEIGSPYEFDANGRRFKARLRALLSKVDYDTRTVTAIFDVMGQKAKTHIIAGELAQLNLEATIESKGFWLPTSALAESRRGLWSVLALQQPDEAGTTILSRREVQILHTEAERVFARGTLRQGDRIVSGGLHRLVAGQRVRPLEQMSTAGAGQ